MKTPLYLLLFAALTVHATAQEKTLDQAHMKCMYRATELKDTLDVAVYEDLLVLQVGPRVSKCYSYYTAQNDSLHRTPEGQKAWSEMFNRALADYASTATASSSSTASRTAAPPPSCTRTIPRAPSP